MIPSYRRTQVTALLPNCDVNIIHHISIFTTASFLAWYTQPSDYRVKEMISFFELLFCLFVCLFVLCFFLFFCFFVFLVFLIQLLPIFWEATKFISKVVVQVYIRTSNEGVFHFFHKLNIMCCSSLTFWITLVWKSILFDIRMATPACFFRPFAWKFDFQPFTLRWCLSLSLRQNVLSFKS